MAYVTPSVGPTGAVVKQHWGGSLWALRHIGITTTTTVYIGLVAVAANIVVAVVLTPLLRAFGQQTEGPDETAAEDYSVEACDHGVEPLVVDLTGAAEADAASSPRGG